MRSSSIHFVLLICFILISNVSSAIELPDNLTRNELDEVTELLGFSTSSKLLSNPYALGGHSGFEIGYSTEFINTTDLSRLGSGAAKDSTYQFNRISFGKGVYNNVDIFFHFVPFSSSNEVSEYGGILKWGFYESDDLPLTLSLLAQTSTININDEFINEVLGADLLAGLNLTDFAIYIGGGSLRARSSFSRSILDSSVTLNSSGTLITRNSRAHTFAGININFKKIFIAAQIDRYDQPVYSAKIGLRF